MIEKKIDQIIREVPNFPKQGINFKDITSLLLDSDLSNEIADAFIDKLDGIDIDAIVGVDVIFLLEYLLKSKTWSFYPKIVLHKTYNLGLSSYIGDSVTKSYLRIFCFGNI